MSKKLERMGFVSASPPPSDADVAAYARRVVPMLVETLRAVEWGADDLCPFCRADKVNDIAHGKGCIVYAALTEARVWKRDEPTAEELGRALAELWASANTEPSTETT